MTSRARVVVASPDDATRAFVRLTLGDERFDRVDEASLTGAVAAAIDPPAAVLVLDSRHGNAEVVALLHRMRDEPATAAIRTLLLVPRGEQVPDGAVADAVLVVPATAFALLRKVDQLAGDPA